jgi:hypothetical protein
MMTKLAEEDYLVKHFSNDEQLLKRPFGRVLTTAKQNLMAGR